MVISDGASWSTCYGTLYDSGGPGGNYGDLEDMTATLCPAGGSGSSPATSVYFISWNVQPGPNDQLFIHDGTSTADPLLATGDGSNDLTGQTITATGTSGCLTFHWVSNGTNAFPGWAAEVVTGPDAGTNGSRTVCSSETAFSLIGELGGSPETGGTWTGPGGPHSPNFNPGSDPGGVYTYTVAGAASCPDSSATVTITRVLAPNAGTNGAVSVCVTGPSVNLFNSLGGTPDAGGTWTGPGGPHDGTYDPSTDDPGDYTYTIVGTPPCATAAATVTVTENLQPDAGTNASITVCSDMPPFDLFIALSGSPDPGGAWTFGGGPVSSMFTPGTSTPGAYTYTLNGVPPCTNASATVTVAQTMAPNPGTSTSITVCSDDASFSMVSLLGGAPGGTWVGPGGAHPDLFNPAVDPGGLYTYTIPGTPPCTSESATLNITVRTAPNAGSNGTIAVCSTDGNFQLFSILGASPDVGGAWTAPGGAPHSGTFDPGVSTPGTYIYTVTGQSPCGNDISTVTVTVNNAPDAGTNATVLRCSDAANVNLFNQLGGAPNDAGGTWSGPSVLVGGIFDPGVSLPGVYTYTVAGLAPCANATATVTVTVIDAPDAGGNGAVTVCSIDGAFDLFSLLTNSPDAGGAWTMPGGGAHSSTFVPGTDPEGVWTYTVLGTPPCANDVSTVTVTVHDAPDPGTNGSVTLCSTDPPETLFVHLGGTPDVGGTWTRPSGTSHGGIYDPANVNHMAGVYTYHLTGQVPCPNASATVLVTENPAPNAGNGTTVTRCNTDGTFNLFGVLTGGPNATGFWLDPANGPFTDPFNPSTSTPGLYKYIVVGLPPCENDTSFVTVVVNQAPDAGTNGTLSICSNGATVALMDSLGGTPDAGGTWTGPSPTSGNYDPATMAPGVYTYTVEGSSPCTDASATVVVIESQQPDAGNSASVQVCSTEATFALFPLLAGTPSPGGTWSGPPGSPGSFTPGVSPPGIYTYSLIGSAPCLNASANVTVVVNPAPDAGISGSLTVCEGTPSVDLFNGLSGSPDMTGTWNDDDVTGLLSGNILNPASLPPGDYHFTYTVPGFGPCGDASSAVTVTIVSQLNAGTDGTISVCSSNTQVDLFSSIGGSPQPGGVWIDLDGTGALFGGYFFNADMPPAGSTYHFRYRLAGIVGCASDSSLATINVVGAPQAGDDGDALACSNGAAFNLFLQLGGTPDPGGLWKFNWLPHGVNYDPAVDISGDYYYIKAGVGPCTADTAMVTVTEYPAPNAGQSNAVNVCSNSGAVNMTSQLLGAPSPTGTWTNPLGQAHGAIFIPGFDPPGCYTYTVAGNPGCAAAITSLCINVFAPPSAGLPAQTTVCSNGGPVILFTLLSGAQSGGSWTGPAGPHSGVYIPAVDSAGVYTYIVTAPPPSPCAPDQTAVTVFENEAPDAGINASITLCSNGGVVNLFTQLGGTPDPTGSWTFGGGPHSGIFIPGTSTPGCYTYTVPGVTPCTTATATVCVAVNAPPNAGASANIVVCSDQTAFALFDELNGTPDPGGTWAGPGGSSGIFIPGVTPPGCYTYTVEGDLPCASAIATVCVTVNPAANAGLNGSVTLCNTSAAEPLFPHLGGTPQNGGTWTGPDGPHSGTFLPGTDEAGVYTYTVTGLAPCASDSATVTVVVNEQPDAGSNGTITVCSNNIPFALFGELNGSPDGGGAWNDPDGDPHSGIYLPGTSEPGVYTYTIEGDAPCADASATVTVIENELPDAGASNAISICSDDPPFQLFDQLLGTPDIGGSWEDEDGDPFPGTYIPGASEAGVYAYTVDGISPCADASATVTIFESVAPDAGISTAEQVCTNAAPFLLIDLLAGTPDPGGTWNILGGLPHSGLFDPAVDASATYVYTVPGIAPCTDAVSSVQVTLIPAANAGGDGDLTVCIDDPEVDLFAGLVAPFDGTGTWNNDDGVGSLAGSIFNATGVASGTYHFTYSVPGITPCADDNAMVTVTITEALNAGADASIQACESENAVNLFSALGGSAQPGGTWIDVGTSGAFFPPHFNATLVPAGSTWTFIYILSASAGCLRDSAIVSVEVLEGPDAGNDGSITVCSNSSSFNLGLPVNADAGGAWFDPLFVQVLPPVFDPAADPPGAYSYVLPAVGNCPGDTSHLIITVNQAPNAGLDGTLNICSNDDPVLLANYLGGTPDPGGTWYFPIGVPHGTIYSPASDISGLYRYTVTGATGCANATAIVTVTENDAAFAGLNNAIARCSDEAPFGMIGQLGGVPQGGGTWRAPDGSVHGPVFDPPSDEGGTYAYIVAGIGACENDTAFLTVLLTIAPEAGMGGILDVCATESNVDLTAGLGGTPDTTGTWQDIDGTLALFGEFFNATAVVPGTYHFQYFVAGTSPCSDDSTTVTVNVGVGASAGLDSAILICGGFTDYDLFLGLGGTPDPGGTWNDDLGTGAMVDGILDASALPQGTPFPYTYTITDPGCGDVSATVLVTTSAYPDPGGDSTATLCSNDADVGLFAFLQGTPDLGGNWTDPGGDPHGGVFTPGAGDEGAYTYTVDGNASCPDSSATIIVVVNDPPDAGLNGVMLECDTATALDLYTGLDGTPDIGGTWSDVDGTGALTGGFLNTTGLPPGDYDFIYTVSVAGCASDEALVKVTVVEGVTVSDTVLICNEELRTYTISFTITGGDPATYTVTGVPGTISGTAPYVFTSDPLFDSQSFTVVVDDQYSCGPVSIEVNSPCVFTDDVFIPQSFSPNGDGINETFFIPGIEGFPGNEIHIFNRWSAEVFSASGYDNQVKVWDGTSANAVLPGDLPAGTYYYILDLGNGGEVLKGYIYLNR